MPRLQLRVYIEPGQAEVFINLRQKDGGYFTYVAIIDTGAEATFLPDDLMDILDYRLGERGQLTIEQAGIAQQVTTITEAYVNLFLEDAYGNRTSEFEVRVWFADTAEYLLGFLDVLDGAVFHLDMPSRTGYLEFPS